MKAYDISGTWRFKADIEQLGLINKYFEHAVFDNSITLPSTVSQQKKVPQSTERYDGYLTDPYASEGFMWYERDIELPENDLSGDCIWTLFLERTRISHVWIDGVYIGTQDSICTPHRYNISAHVRNHFRLTIMTDNVNYKTKGGHMTSPDTQTNWNGIIGKLQIQRESKTRLKNIKIYTDSFSKIVRIKADLEESARCGVHVNIENLTEKEFELTRGSNELEIKLPESTKMWSDYAPNLYKLVLTLDNSEQYETEIGVKSFRAKKTHLYINDQKIFLRGKHDGMIFPMTGAAPADVESWLRVMGTAKQYGINHYRFHTCCPPEAAFVAADRLGIYMEPELPFWGTIQAEDEEGFNKTEQDYLISEGFRILDEFANHPSFSMMSLGNELWGSSARLEEILKGYKSYDSRPLYILGSNTFQFVPVTTQSEDVFVGVRFGNNMLFRGSYAMCDAPQGFVQTDIPNTAHDYDILWDTDKTSNSSKGNNSEEEIEIQYGTGVRKVHAQKNKTSHFLPNKPVISHEIGQYCMYPNYSQIEKYTGVLKPYNFEIFRERLDKAGMLSRADDFFRDSSKLSVQCYRLELETALRSRELSGFQILDIQDFTGQGTAVVGILDAFMESKGVITPEQWRQFCGETVLLASFDKFVWKNGDEFKAALSVADYSGKCSGKSILCASLLDTDTKEVVCENGFDINLEKNETYDAGLLSYTFKDVTAYKSYILRLSLNTKDGGAFSNEYTLYVYPESGREITRVLRTVDEEGSAESGGIIITTDNSEAVKKQAEGKRVLLLAKAFDTSLPGLEHTPGVQTVEGTYCTDFWCYTMFRQISESMKKRVPIGTLGLTIQNGDKVFASFPTETFTTPKWYKMISDSVCVNLGGTDIQPVIQMIDNFERNWKLGILYRANGITVCTIRLQKLTDCPEAMAFAESLVKSL